MSAPTPGFRGGKIPPPSPSQITPGRMVAMMAAAAALIHPYRECGVCVEYATRRTQSLPEAIVSTARGHGVNAGELLDDFMDAVHDRHLDGLPL